MTRFTPLWQQGGSYAAAVDRNLVGALYPVGAASGAVPAPVANTMNVSIPPGRAAVPLQAGANSALCAWDAAEVVTSPAAPPAGNTRIDLIILQVRDPQLDAGINNDFIFQVLSGAPSTGTPVAPTVPTNALAVCQYTVPAAVANLNGVTVVDVRPPTRPNVPMIIPAVMAPTYTIPVSGQYTTGQLSVPPLAAPRVGAFYYAVTCVSTPPIRVQIKLFDPGAQIGITSSTLANSGDLATFMLTRPIPAAGGGYSIVVVNLGSSPVSVYLDPTNHSGWLTLW
jgi:hypothetical protein